MKICTKCGVESDNFSPNKKAKDLLASWCRNCKNIRAKKNSRTKKGLSDITYQDQKRSSRNRGQPMPDYTSEELRIWIFSQPNFEKLYNNWADSGYDKILRPSVDRLNDYKPYTFDNIQLMTWGENKAKGHRDRKNGVNNKDSKAVIGTHKTTGEKIEFYSQHEASRVTGIYSSNISKCCRGIYKYCGDYIWEYKALNTGKK